MTFSFQGLDGAASGVNRKVLYGAGEDHKKCQVGMQSEVVVPAII